MLRLSRRHFLSSSALVFASAASAEVITSVPVWVPFAQNPPQLFADGQWYFLKPDEIETLDAMAEQLIPGDATSLSGKEAGCTSFIDRQLAGPYGEAAGEYRAEPYLEAPATLGDQWALTPRDRYRTGLAAVTKYCTQTYQKNFAQLSGATRDEVLHGLEQGKITLEGLSASAFFEQLLGNIMEGFFADPIYGGNKEMTSWKMLGYPGARYDYSNFVMKHNQKIELAPISLALHP